MMLRWDGKPRIRYALHHFPGAEVSGYNKTCLRVFMLGAVKRIFEPGAKSDPMPVLTQRQHPGLASIRQLPAL